MTIRIRVSHPLVYFGIHRPVGAVLDVDDNFALRAIAAGLARRASGASTPTPLVLDAQLSAAIQALVGGGGSAVSSINGQVGVVVLNKGDLGLANVNNTADASKPVSAPQQVALDALTATVATKAPQSDVDALAANVSWARNIDQLVTGAITRDANGAATSAPVTWPDGTPGTYTALVLSTAFPGAVDSYEVTYGDPATMTFTQPTLTRDGAGAVVALPAIVVT